jgi:hypothetical protein
MTTHASEIQNVIDPKGIARKREVKQLITKLLCSPSHPVITTFRVTVAESVKVALTRNPKD